MNKLNKISALALSLLMLACSKPDIEIVEQNNSYSLDPKVTHVEMPDKVPFDPANLVRLTSDKVVGIGALLDIKNRDRGLELELDKISLELQIKRPLKTATKVTITENRELLKEYAGDKANRKAFPNGVIATKEFTIPAGVTKFVADLDMVDIKALNDLSGYLTAYSLSIVPGGDDVTLANSSTELFVALDIEEYDSDPDMIPVTMSITNSRDRTASYGFAGNNGLIHSQLVLNIGLDKESPLPIEFRIEQDRDLLGLYTGSTAPNGDPFPEWFIAPSYTFTIPAKTKTFSAKIPLPQTKPLTKNNNGYLTAFKLVPVSFPEYVTVDEAKSMHFLGAMIY